MGDNLTSIFLAFFVVCVPVWIVFNFLAKSRAARQLNKADAVTLDHALANMHRLEQRMLVLEHILDAQAPSWRQTSDLGVRGHETI